ncbi:kinesin-like nuclear fusion protein [Mitosporidium daphniae]
MPLKENVARNTDTILSPTRLKLPSKSINTALLAPTSSSIPSRSLPVHSDIDRSQILLSPQFKHLKYKKDSTCTSSFSNLLPTNQIQIGIKTNDVSSLASFVNPNTIKAKPTTPHGLLEDAMEDVKMYKREYSKLTTQYKESIDRLNELESIASSLESAVKGTTSEKLTLREKLELMEKSLTMNEKEYGARISKITADYDERLSSAKETNFNLSRSLELSRKELEMCNSEIAKLNATIEAQKSTLSIFEGAKLSLDRIISEYQRKEKDSESTISQLSQEVAALRKLAEELKTDAIEGEKLRKRLHNEVQELKGNIRVFCRVRPPLPSICFLLNIASDGVEESALRPCEQEVGNTQISFSSDPLSRTEGIELSQWMDSTSGCVKPQLKSYPFTFDRVFSPTSTQADVFEDISQLVQSVLDGYRVCIFAYGQTGSGKTYTMEGPSGKHDPSFSGMIPRAVAQIFETSHNLGVKNGWKFQLEASFLEIYNETIKDLLATPKSIAGCVEELKKLEIKHNPTTGKTSVSELTIGTIGANILPALVPVTSISQVNRLLKEASENRSIGETRCNERSSRSHSVFTLSVAGENPDTGEKIEGLLNLIDLAGSERLSSSGATGDRLKETQAINKSLSALGDVIMALANKESHIPYRNSKLTYLLQNSLGGNSKTLMFVNLSPSKESFGESLCSLRFAAKVNSCHIGTARKNLAK